MNIRNLLHERVKTAMVDAGVPADDCHPHVTVSKKPEFGDYQANGAMGAAKAMGVKPRDLAQRILDNLQLEEIAQTVDIAGPGFINIHLKPQWLAQHIHPITHRQTPEPLTDDERQTVVVDYSSPNLAKEMHVGHLRSTIIGDATVRVLEFLGHTVIRQNHVGDWGTQFGMLVAELENHLGEGERAELALRDLEGFYQQAKQHFDSDEAFATRARDYVVRLQSGDADILALWEKFTAVSMQHSSEIYDKLHVTLKPEHVRGESVYNPDLPVLVKELQEQGFAVTDQGAQVVFLQELADKNGDPSPVIVQKRDGGYLYATTDLAALRYRATALRADRVLYFTDARQALHMQQVFTLARKAGFVDAWVSLEHLTFGTMKGEDGKPFKTRSGGTIKLSQLLDEAVERAQKVVADKNPDLPQAQAAQVARKVGIGAVKYADLCKTRTHDYVFSWDAMLSFDGNTGPYLQYAYTRVRSIFRKAGIDMTGVDGDILLEDIQEKALALKLLQFIETVEQVGEDALPHLLCTYLYELASLFMSFYEACPILRSDIVPQTRDSRLLLCRAVANTLETGLDLLGIEVMERM